MQNASAEITLLIRCQELPGTECAGKTAARLGIQKGAVVIEDVPADVEGVTFTVPIGIRRASPTSVPDYSGPFVQGKKGERFLYLNWGERNGQEWEGFGRVKLSLSPLTGAVVDKALQTGEPVRVTITMTDAKGKPVFATVREEYLQWMR